MMIMGTAYKVRCKYCGAQFGEARQSRCGIPVPRVTGQGYIETQTAIRCPVCHKKLNATQEEFLEQLEVTYVWN